MLFLGRKMTVILLIKLVALMGLYFLFFGAAHRVNVDSARVQARFYSSDLDGSSGEK